MDTQQLKTIHALACAAVARINRTLSPVDDRFWPLYLNAALSTVDAVPAPAIDIELVRDKVHGNLAIRMWKPHGALQAGRHTLYVGPAALAAQTPKKPADWRGDFERQARIGDFDLSREEWGGDYSNSDSQGAWMWYYHGRLDGECGVGPDVAPATAPPGEPAPCKLGVGCESVGACHAEHHGEPEKCGRKAAQPDDLTERAALKRAMDLLDAKLGDTDPNIEGMTQDEVDATYPVLSAMHILSRLYSAAGPVSLSNAARDVLAERARQVSVEGWTPEHDDKYQFGEMASAAGCYAMYTEAFPPGDPASKWPWDKDWWKPTTQRRNRVKAAALLLAEIERIDRATRKAEIERRGGEA
ncbi:hypothetical protein PT2222_300039 [Paraburkholderia tropica]